MAKFLNTSKTISELEDLINNAEKELILISPYLKLTDKLRDLLADKNRLKVDMRIVYGKTELATEEMNWLKTQSYIRVSFYKELHAKCYLSEKLCIITSLNLLEYSINNNYEMGVLINKHKDEDAELYNDAYDEVKRIIRSSKDINNLSPEIALAKPDQKIKTNNNYDKPTTAELAKKLGLKKDEFIEKLVSQGYLEVHDDKHQMTEKGKAAGGEVRNGRYGLFDIWPADFNPETIKKISTAELAAKRGFSSNFLMALLVELGYLEARDKKIYLTEKGKLASGELRPVESGYSYFWSENIVLTVQTGN